jgi:hypothetical protein
LTGERVLAGDRHIALLMGASGMRTAMAVALSLLLAACSALPRWQADENPVNRDAARLFRPEGALGAPRDPYMGEIARVPMRANMRPCCAFGAQLHVRVGPVPVPFYFMGNIVEPRLIRHHVYDSGNATFGSRGAGPEIIHSEGNGLVYTCHGGFIDVAHVRDYSDTAVYIITALARQLATGGTVPLPDEGATVDIDVHPVPADVIQQQGLWSIAIPLGQWLAFQSGLWHEIATWFGWSTFELFPERVSSFSPEDLYSNLIGARIAAAVVSQRGARDEFAYNRNVDRWLKLSLEQLGAVNVPTAKEAMHSIDGLWWDSSKRLPDMALVLRRNFASGDTVTPWLVPPPIAGPMLRGACGDHPEPAPIANPSAMSGIDFDEQAMLVVKIPESLASQEPFASLGRRVLTQKDFPAILEFIRAQNHELFGPDAELPDAVPR